MSTPIKAAFLTAHMSNRSAGVWAAVIGNSKALIEAGVVAGAIGVADPNEDIPATIAGSFLFLRRCKVLGPHSFGYAPHMLPALRQERPDLVHAQGLWMYPSVASRMWHRETGSPYLVQPHGMLDSWAVRNSAWKKRIVGHLYENAHLRRAACLHALNLPEALAIRAFGLKNPICVVPNGIDLPNRNHGEPTWLRPSDRNRKRKRLLFLGRIHPKKGLPALLRAWAEVGNAARDWELVIAGWSQGYHEQDLKRLIEELALGEVVRFVGPQFNGEKAATFSAADAFILPSLSEGLPMAVLEAWAYGLPVLMTSECNLPIGFESGAAVRIGNDVAAIATGLRELMEMSKAERKIIGERGRKLAIDHFSWKKAATEIRAVYEWILGGGAPPSCVLTS